MKTRLPLLLAALCLLPATAFAAKVDLDNPDPAAVTAALAAARDEGAGFHLLAHCLDEQGNRRLETFPSGVAIWKGRVQFALPDALRRKLLDTLLARGFAALEPSYGGKPRPVPGHEDEEWEDDEGEAALRVRCRLVFASGEVAKTSIQQADGEQSAALTGLIAALLDGAEPVAEKSGVGAEDFADGLAKLADGTLAPETFSLRFVRLPKGDGEIGDIVFVDRGTLTTRRYAPRRELGEPTSEELGADRFRALIEGLHRADLASLPGNLWSDDQLDLEVHVLDREETVLARPFARLRGQEGGPAQVRFDALVGFLRQALLGEEMEDGGGERASEE